MMWGVFNRSARLLALLPERALPRDLGLHGLPRRRLHDLDVHHPRRRPRELGLHGGRGRRRGHVHHPVLLRLELPESVPRGGAAAGLRRLKKERRLAAAETSLDVFVVGLSHHNAKVEVREKLAVPQDEWSESAQAIVDDSNGAIAEAAVLSTCNRFEVYFSARDARAAFASISQHFQERSGLHMAELRESLFMLTESDASAHALRVSAGLDSLVVGEGQILSQMKACYANAIEGAGGKVTSRLLNTAVAAGKEPET